MQQQRKPRSAEQQAAARERAKAWYWANKERSLAANAKWRADNSERHCANASAYFQAHKTEIQQARKIERAINAEAHYRYQQEYRARNIERIRAYRKDHKSERIVVQNNRRAREFGGDKLPVDIVAQLLRLQKLACANCRTNLKKSGHHLDHITPLSKGGKNTRSSVELLCPECNLRKRAKVPVEWAQQNGRLL